MYTRKEGGTRRRSAGEGGERKKSVAVGGSRRVEDSFRKGKKEGWASTFLSRGEGKERLRSQRVSEGAGGGQNQEREGRGGKSIAKGKGYLSLHPEYRMRAQKKKG